MFYVKNRPKTLAKPLFLCYNPFRYTKESQRAKMYAMIPKTPYFILLNGLLNINECFISFGNLSRICRYSE